MKILKRLLIKSIRLYQKAISPNHSFLGKLFPAFGCRFYPSCSQYAIEAIEAFGIYRGFWLGLKRVSRCHPWNDGGIDRINFK